MSDGAAAADPSLANWDAMVYEADDSVFWSFVKIVVALRFLKHAARA
jgi:hypothetical protein